MFNFLQDMFNYESRVLDRTEVSGLAVSTVWTSDEGYETAIIDTTGVHPCERYPDRDAAVEGHARWTERAKNGLVDLIELGGLAGLVAAEPITLRPKQ